MRANQSGFSVVEVLLAATLFGFLATALVGALVYGRSSTANAGERARAVMIAEEGLEAVRNIRDSGWANLTISTPTHGLAQSGSPQAWNFSGTSDTTGGLFVRKVTVTDVDATHKDVTVVVEWTTTGHLRSVTVSERFANWSASGLLGPIMMAYSKTTTTPFYRLWNGSSWSAEASANNVVGNINYVVLKSARTRNEAIMGVQTSTGAIYVQVWNGAAWGTATQVGTSTTTTRGFDISYEKSSDRALIVYGSSADFAYRIWNGTTLSSATSVTAPPTTGTVNWIQTQQNPLSGSNEIAMIMLDSLSDVYGMIWNGSSWGTMGVATVWDNTAATATKKTIDVEYEQLSGRAMFIWGDGTATDQNYRTWNGTTLSNFLVLDIPTAGGVSEWVQLAARPNSNEIMYGVQDAGADLNTRKWSGSAWDTAIEHPEHIGQVENITSRNFDIAWETYASNAGDAWLLYCNGGSITNRLWSGTAWGTNTNTIAGSDDTSFIRLKSDPVSGAILAGVYEASTSATDDIWETHVTGGGSAWTAKNILWGGPISAEPVYFRVDISVP